MQWVRGVSLKIKIIAEFIRTRRGYDKNKNLFTNRIATAFVFGIINLMKDVTFFFLFF